MPVWVTDWKKQSTYDTCTWQSAGWVHFWVMCQDLIATLVENWYKSAGGHWFRVFICLCVRVCARLKLTNSSTEIKFWSVLLNQSHLSLRHILWRHTLLVRLNTHKWEHASVWQLALVPKNRNKRNECTVSVGTHTLTNTILYIYPHLLLLPPPLPLPLSSLILFFFSQRSLWHFSFLTILFIFHFSLVYFPCLVPFSSQSLPACVLSFFLPPALISLTGSFSPSRPVF